MHGAFVDKTRGCGVHRWPFRANSTRTAALAALVPKMLSSAPGSGVDRVHIRGRTRTGLAETDRTVGQRKQRVVAAAANVLARVNLGTTLTNDDAAGADLFTAETLDTKTFRV